MSREPLQIAIVSSPKTWGGGEELAWTLGNGLMAKGHEVAWVTRSGSVLHERLSNKNKECLLIQGKYPSIWEVVSLRQSLREKKITTIYGNDSRAINWSGLLGFGMRGVSKIGVKHTVFPIKSALKYNWFLDRIMCVSNASREVCIKGGIRRSAVQTVYGGLELPSYDRAVEREKIADSLGIDRKMPLYCQVGSLIGCKGVETVIQAASLMRARGQKFMIAVCGDGALKESLQKQINTAGLTAFVRLVGFQEAPYRWIAASDALLHPSRSEGLSLVTIAAQLLGTPVVATSVGGLHEVMHNPKTHQPLGWIVQHDSPGQIADAIEQLTKDRHLSDLYVANAKECANGRFLAHQMIESVVRMVRAISPATITSLPNRNLVGSVPVAPNLNS